MLLVNVSAVQWRERRRARNEAFFHYLLRDEPTLDRGLFINNTTGVAAESAAVEAVQHEGTEGSAPYRVLQPLLSTAVRGRTGALASAYFRHLQAAHLPVGDYVLLMNSPFAFSTELSKLLAPCLLYTSPSPRDS